MVHILKIDRSQYCAIVRGYKKYEVRFNDRDFQVGDYLLLKETKYSSFDMRNFNKPLEYTGNEYMVRIDHILNGGQYGIVKDYVILSISTFPKFC